MGGDANLQLGTSIRSELITTIANMGMACGIFHVALFHADITLHGIMIILAGWMKLPPYTWIYHYRDFIRDQYYQFKISIRERREIHPDDGEPNELYLMFEKNMHNGGNSFVARVVLTRHTPENDKSFKLAYHDTHPGTIFTNKYDDAGLTGHQKARVLISLADDFLTMLLHRHSDNLPQIWFEVNQILPIYMSFCYRYRHCTFELDDPDYSCERKPNAGFIEYLRPDEL